jgi:hypothetical protein
MLQQPRQAPLNEGASHQCEFDDRLARWLLRVEGMGGTTLSTRRLACHRYDTSLGNILYWRLDGYWPRQDN